MPGQKTTQEPMDGGDTDTSVRIEDADLRRLFDYWRSLRQGRSMPSKNDIDPLDIGWALSRIYLLDYTPAAGFVYCLAGVEVAGVFGRANLKGLKPRDFLPPDRAVMVEGLFRRVVEERCVMWMKGLIYLRADRVPTGERLFLPLGDDAGNEVTGILGMTVVHSVAPEGPIGMSYPKDHFVPVDDLP
ncbi:PAS domain-containing protein [Pelagibius sp. CAU 1746]|uniref:PAS domain-containing protein n=1 Tax=Pelagibius sp. CAU 1746 TaxID=3140370 RepID=UPI00325B76FC